VGNSDVGKTCLIRKYQLQDSFQVPKHKISTLGIENKVVRLKVNGQMVRVVLWDPAGQERFESMTKSFFQQLDGVLLVFDVTQEKSVSSLTKWLQQIHETKPCPYMIAANKCDLEDQRIISEEQIGEIEERFATQCVPTSAVTGLNVDHAFNLIINTIVQIKLTAMQ
jgi:small GTP-binding protein